MDKKLLGIYINDHLAGHVAGLELARRTASSNEGTDLGHFLKGFVDDLEQEKQVIEQALESVDSDPARIKMMAAWIAEKAGRLKLNGQVTGYSPLSRVLEVEAMGNGVASKIDLWKTLLRVGVQTGADLSALIERAEAQRTELETQRQQALSEAFMA